MNRKSEEAIQLTAGRLILKASRVEYKYSVNQAYYLNSNIEHVPFVDSKYIPLSASGKTRFVYDRDSDLRLQFM